MICYDNARVLNRSFELTTYSLAKGAIMHNKCDICMLANRQSRTQQEKRFEVDGNTLCKHKRYDQPATDKFCILHQSASPGKEFSQTVVEAVEDIKKNGIAHTPQGLEQFMAKMRSGKVKAVDTEFRHVGAKDGGDYFGANICLREVAVIGLDEEVFFKWGIADLSNALDDKDKQTLITGLRNIQEDDFILEYSTIKCDRRVIAPFFRNDQGNLEGFPKEPGRDTFNAFYAWKRALPELPAHHLSTLYLALIPDDKDDLLAKKYTALADAKMLACPPKMK